MNAFSFMTLNCNGAIKHKDLQNRLKSCLEVNQINTLFLQETHVSNLRFKEEIESEFSCTSYWSFGENDSRGTAILIFHNFEFKVEKFRKDKDGRLLFVDINSDYGEARLVTVYCPNDIQDRKKFLQEIDQFLSGSKPLITGGDWNFIENPNLDKEGGNPNRGCEGSTIFHQTKRAYNLVDPFRHLNKTAKVFTWENETKEIRTRIDRFYISKTLLDQVVEVKNITSTVSDHYGVKLSFSKFPTNKYTIGKGIWKINTSILEDPNFIKKI